MHVTYTYLTMDLFVKRSIKNETYNFYVNLAVGEMKIMMGLPLVGAFILRRGSITEQRDKLVVKLSHTWVAYKAEMIVSAPVGDVVHTHTSIPEKTNSISWSVIEIKSSN